MSAACANWARPEKASARLATAGAPRTSLDAPTGKAARSARTATFGAEHREQRIEVTIARGGKEGVDNDTY
jgi:hypothetical protein